MPSRLFDQLDVIGIVDTHDTLAHVSVSGSFGDWILSGSAVDSQSGINFHLVDGCYGTYRKTGIIDFTKTPRIPINALISKVSFKIAASLIGTGVADCNGIIGAQIGTDGRAEGNAKFGFNIDVDGWIVTLNIFADDPKDANFLLNSLHSSASDSDSRISAFEDIIDSYPLTYDQFITKYGIVTLEIYTNTYGDSLYIGGTSGSGSINTSFSGRLYDFQLEVTYTAGPFSWYIQTHEDTIGGQPATIVDDIVAVTDGDTPPVGYEYYASDDTYPISIPLYNWYEPTSGTVINQPFPPGEGWLLQLAEIVSELGVELALESKVVAIVNPSGIYTLIEGKRHDTLYERLTGITSINVAIPRPYGTTGFIPE